VIYHEIWWEVLGQRRRWARCWKEIPWWRVVGRWQNVSVSNGYRIVFFRWGKRATTIRFSARDEPFCVWKRCTWNLQILCASKTLASDLCI
jgi:hypothetical protein